MGALGLQLNVPPLGNLSFDEQLDLFTWGVRLECTETGNPIVNQAAPGTADGTGANVTFAQPGGVEGRVAIDFAAANSIITVPNSARWILADFTVVWFFNADNSIAAGWRICQNVGDQINFSPRLDGSIDYRVNRATTNATYTSAAGEISYPTGLMMLAMNYNETAGITAWKGKNGALTQITSVGTPAVIGSGATVPFTGTLNIGNNGSATRAFDGRASFFGFSNPGLVPDASNPVNLRALLLASGV